MRLLNLVIAASALLFAIGTVNILLLWSLHSSWWKIKIIRFLAFLFPIAAVASAVLWALSYLYGWHQLELIVRVATPSLLLVESAILISLPFSGIVHFIANAIDYFERPRKGQSFSGGRRRFLKLAAGVFPAAAIPSAVTGVVDSYAPITVPVKRIPVVELPESLEGFKIAHLSDLHLGYYVHLDHLKSAVEEIRSNKPDLVLVTGDISDDLYLLPDVIETISSLRPRFGTYASVGNHEYYRGIEEVLKIFARSPFPMLINQHINLSIGNTPVTLGGADDPRTLRRDYTAFLQNTIENSMRYSRQDSFKLLMCHRPEGFNYSALKGIDLVLSGHTHGGQIGFGGRSLLESVFPEKYLWGTYRRGKTTLYTSAGMGHWLPFRLGVPAEAPILVLEKAAPEPAQS